MSGLPKLNSIVRALILSMSFFCFIELSQAQSRSDVRGVVEDPSGAVIVGAKIVLQDAAGHRVAQTVSDSYGSFHFPGVISGRYVVVARREGFADKDVKFSVRASPALLHIRMALAAITAHITVGGEATRVNTDAANNQSTNQIDQTALDRLPVFDQDYITFMSQFLDPSSVATGGVTLVVDGVEANGPDVTPSAIQEVKVNNNPYSALFSRPGRARLEITTKPGTPQLHGTINFLFRDSTFDARNAFAVTKPPEQRRYWEGSLTGPVTRSKKTTFLASIQYDQDNVQSIVLAETPTGTINENVPSPMRHFFGSGRVFHDFGAANQFWIGYSYEDRKAKNQGVGGEVLPEAGYSGGFQEEHKINLSHRVLLSPRWMNQFRFLVGHYNAPTVSNVPAAKVVVPGEFTGGGAQADARNTEFHVAGNDTVMYSTPRHALKFGIDVPDISRRGRDDWMNQIGTYSFATIANFLAGHAETAVIQRGEGHLVFLEKVLGPFIEDTIRVKPSLLLSLGLRYYWQNYFHDDSNNFAPRLGFAWALGPQGKTVFRGGAGVFFDRTGPAPIADLLRFDGRHLVRYVIESPSVPVQNLTLFPPSVVTLDPRAVIPYTLQWSLGVERQLTSKSTITAEWVGMRGVKLFRSVDANAPPPPFYSSRPDATLGQVREIQSQGRLASNALEVSFRGTISKYFEGQAQYRLAKAYENTSGITWFPANSYFPDAEWARSDTDQRNRFTLLGTFKLPEAINFGLATALYSGMPYSETTGRDDNHDGILNDRPAGVPRNSLHGPRYGDVDLRATRDFVVSRARKEAVVMTVGLSAFNVLNHRNDTAYVGTLGSPFFGHAVSAGPARRMQLNLELKF
jgi:hypothetical protein